MFDFAIMGGGPAGYVAAEKAALAGLKTVLFEKNEVGGVCLHEGCIPTKALLHCAKLYESAGGSAKFGVKSEGVSYDLSAMLGRKDRVVRRLAGGVRARLRNAGVTVVSGEARIEAPGTISCGEDCYEWSKLLICTGSTTAFPPVPGLGDDAEAVITSREALCPDRIPERLTLIGGGVIGMEFASLYRSLGSQVTVIEQLPEILATFDSEVSALLRSIYERKGVTFRLGCTVTEARGGEVLLRDADGNAGSVISDKILVSVGRRANLHGYGLEKLGVETDRGIVVDSHMRTSVEGVYAAGDVTGRSMLAHSASREAEVAVNDILGIPDEMLYNAIPGVVYTNPEAACVGLSEQEAARQGMEFEVHKLPMAYSGRYVAENENIEGLCKIISSPGGRILGAHMLGNPCGEIIQSFCLAISNGLGLRDLRRTVFPHPSVSEIIRETVSDSTAD